MAENKITEIGLIEKVKGDKALVRILQKEEDEEKCKACGMCSAGKEGRFIEVAAAGVEPGMRVKLEMPLGAAMKSVLILMAAPLMLFVAGALAGNFITPLVWPNSGDYSDFISFGLAFLFMGGGYVVIYYWGKKYGHIKARIPEIVHVYAKTPDFETGSSIISENFNISPIDKMLYDEIAAELRKIDGIESASFADNAHRVEIRFDTRVLSRSKIRELLLVMGVNVES